MVERTDEETEDLIREWLRRYAVTIVLGLILGLAVVFSYQWWQKMQRQNYNQAALKLEAIDLAVTNKNYSQAIDDFRKIDEKPIVYYELAKLLSAKAAAANNALDDAKKSLGELTHSKDAIIAQSASFYLAQLHLQTKDYDQALAVLGTLESGIYSAQMEIMRGIIYQQQRKFTPALQAFQRAHEKIPSPFLEAQIKALAAIIATNEVE